jgi:hypothetical protein
MRLDTTPRRAAAILTLSIGATLIGSVSAAQTRSLTWTETTRVEVPGALGLILRATGALSPTETKNAVHVQGRALIEESGNTAYVVDLENGRWISIDHDARTYISMTFDEMARMSREAMYATAQGGSGGAADAAASREEFEREMREMQATFDFRISAEATGQRQRIGSHNATQHFVTTEFEATAVPEGVDEPAGGALLLLAELWQTPDVPDASALHEEWARQLAQDPRVREMMGDVARSAPNGEEAMAEVLAAWDPQVSAGIVKLVEAMETITGTTVRSTTTVALVPTGVRYDRGALLAWQPESMGDRLRSEAAGAARQAATDAARSALGGLSRGRLGGGNAAPAQAAPADAAPSVRPMFRLISSREDIAYRESGRDVLGELTARIADYTKQEIAQ